MDENINKIVAAQLTAALITKLDVFTPEPNNLYSPERVAVQMFQRVLSELDEGN